MKFDHKVFRFWREQRRLTLEECAKAVGASKASVSKWEAGTVIPRPAKIRAIAKLFNISVYDISDLPPEPEIISRTEMLEETFQDPMFDIIVRAWSKLTAADKGEVVEFISNKIKAQK
ncbi:MAG: helix-turn-helix transcriptional regulator [Lentisphaerae bacterium]|nr:helix-turn-helix transcriptional regulator [Lentisphaerota bacterium]